MLIYMQDVHFINFL